MDIEKFTDQVDTFLAGVNKGNKESILKEIKNFREISLNEIIDKFEGKIPSHFSQNS